MKFQKYLILILSFALCLCIFTGCKNDQNTEDPTTTTTEADTTTEEVTTIAPDYSQMTLISTGKALNKDTGMMVKECINSDPYIVNVEITRTSVLLYGYTPGTAELQLTDYFGRKAKVIATVKEGERNIEVSIEPCNDSFIEVSQFGARGTGGDDTSAFQKAINAAKPGDTIHVYPGLYKISTLIMKEGITLKLYTEMTDAKQGFTDEIAAAVKANKYAVLSGAIILNNDTKSSSDNACGNFTISGGVYDCNHTSRGITFGRGDNIRLENIIFKDISNNHVIQITGCTNTTIENCIFAGFKCGDAFTREVVQIEPSHSGAGSLKFEEGEFYYCENITINNCYFGESDELGAPLMAIGHHWYNGKANVSGFKITNNVFDECLYAAIRYNSIIDTEISGNTFISSSKYMNATQYSETTTPAFILLYHPTAETKYKSISGSNVIRTILQAQDGFDNLKIENNTFTLEEGSDKRIIYIVNSSITPGATFTTIKTQDSYNSPVYEYHGFVINKNYAQNVSFSNNTINIKGQPKYTNYYLKLTNIYDLKFEGNKFNLADGVKFTLASSGYEKGQQVSSTDLSGQCSYSVTVKSSDKTITVNCGDQKFKISTSFGGTIVFKKGDGGTLSAEVENGNLVINVIPSEGYKFGSFKDQNSQTPSAEIEVKANTSFNITFVK